jgi:hypothetical protein
MGFEAEAAYTPRANCIADLDHAQIAVQGYHGDGHAHPACVHSRGGSDPETTTGRQRAPSHQPQKAAKTGISYRYLVSDRGSFGLIYKGKRSLTMRISSNGL